MFVLGLAAVGGVFVWRGCGILGGREPFDVEAIRKFKLDDGKNAFTKYRLAVSQLQPATGAANDQLDAAMEEGWSAAGEELRQWVTANGTALDTFVEGTRVADAQAIPANLGSAQATQALIDTVQQLRSLARLAQLEGFRREAAGDLAGAWDLYAAVLRASRHCGMHSIVTSRLVGTALHATVTKAICRWAEDPRVSPEQLRQALSEVQAIYASTSPLSDTLKAEYVLVSEGLRQVTSSSFPLQGLMVLTSGEPNRSQRVLRLIIGNQLTQCDVPSADRAKVVSRELHLFEVDPQGPGDQQCFDADQIVPLYSKTVFAKQVVPVIVQLFNSTQREQARQETLVVALALQIYQREHEQFPETLAALVPQSLERVPEDPYGQPGETLHYRRVSDGAVVWSIGPDGKDDNGEFEFDGADKPADILVRIRVQISGNQVPAEADAK